MSLVDQQVAEFQCRLASLSESAAARQLAPPLHSWPAKRSLVLNEHVAVELGNPAVGELGALLWTAQSSTQTGVWLAGNDLDTLDKSVPFGQLVLVSGRFDNEYGHLLDLHDTLHDFHLEGITARSMPVSARFWYRVSREAQERGFTLAHLGHALTERLMELEGIDAVTLLFVTAQQTLEKLHNLCDEANRIASALIKRNEEQEHECETCDFSDICIEGTTQ